MNPTPEPERDPHALEVAASHAAPAKLAHIVCLTPQLAAMRRWYMAVLNAEPAIENDHLCFLRYDDEHHRIGLIRVDEALARPPGTVAGIHHTAFTFRNLSELLGHYLHLTRQNIKPFWCINHGPTVSMYYRDPDGNRIELQIDTMDDEALDAFFATGAYVDNPIGIIFDPDEWIRRWADGESFETLVARPQLPPGSSPFDQIRD